MKKKLERMKWLKKENKGTIIKMVRNTIII